MGRVTWRGSMMAGTLAAVLSCQGGQPQAEGETLRGETGVFFGGQVQRRLEVPVDAETPPKIGFRLYLPPEHHAPAWHVDWHVVRPGPLGRRVKQVDSVEVPTGQQQFDQLIDIPPDGPLGTYNVRVVVDGKVVIDRALLLRPDS